MNKLLVCIDGSSYADNLCSYAAWAAKRMNVDINLLHVLRRHSDYQASSNDHTGTIGVGSRTKLLEALTEVDEERGRLDQKKGKIILEHGEETLKDSGIENVNIIHKRGALVEIIRGLESDAEIIFMGKRGEHADVVSEFLGANLEKVARSIAKPLFVVSSIVRPIERFLIAYDGKESSSKAIDYITKNPLLLKGLECHLFASQSIKASIDISHAKQELEAAGFKVVFKAGDALNINEGIASYVVDNEIDLLVMGAYSHSRMRNLLLGSTTTALIKTCKIPLLLF